MKPTIDCFFIGHNEMDFVKYEKNIKKMGENSGAYRDLNLSYINYHGKPYTASGIFNLLYNQAQNNSKGLVKPLKLNIYETFSPAIAYLGTYLHRRGLSFDYINSFKHQEEELKEKLRSHHILTIAIITTLYVSVYPVLEIIDFIKRYNHTAKIILGGPFIATQIRSLDTNTDTNSYNDEIDYLFQSIDADFYVNSSQGEAALVNIIYALKNGSSLEKIKNIFYKTEAGSRYVSTGCIKEENKLSGNMVDWQLFFPGPGSNAAVRTAISCPFSCAFCGFPEHAGKYQTVEPEEIKRELDQLQEKRTVTRVSFIDDTFNVPVKRFKEILRMMIKNNYQFKWNCHFRCQFADREMVELMKKSGCEGVFLGIESGNDRVLENMNKAARVEKYLEGIVLLKEYEIMTYGSFIIGFPGETHETVQDTIRFIKESQPDFYRAQLWYCEPITPIWTQRETYGISGSNFEWRHATMDSREAAGLVDRIFVSIESPTWVPQYDFEIYGIFQLLHQGFSLEQVKAFLKSFNNGIKEKISSTYQKDVSDEVMRQLKESCPGLESGIKPKEKTGGLPEDIRSIEVELDI